MLLASDILEIKKHISPSEANIHRVEGWMVDTDGSICKVVDEKFMTLEDDMFHRYLGIANTVLDKKVGNKMVSCNCKEAMQYFLGKVATESNDVEIVNEFKGTLVARMAAGLSNNTKMLILIYHDTYDIPVKGKDGRDQDESDEVYQYIICAICPVSMTSAGLEYLPEEKKLEKSSRDWMVRKPEIGFIYPAFEERTVEWDKIDFYIPNPKQPDHEFMEKTMTCDPQMTYVEMQDEFEAIVNKLDANRDRAEKITQEIMRQLSIYQSECIDGDFKTLEPEELQDILSSIDKLYDNEKRILAENYAETFQTAPPIKALINKRMVEKAVDRIKREEIAKTMIKAANMLEDCQTDKKIVEDIRVIASQQRDPE